MCKVLCILYIFEQLSAVNIYSESMLVFEAPATMQRSSLLYDILLSTGVTSTLMNCKVLSYTSFHYNKLNCTVSACSGPYYRRLQSYSYLSACEYKSETFPEFP